MKAGQIIRRRSTGGVKVGLYLTPQLRDDARCQAEKEGKSLSAWVEETLRKALKPREKRRQAD